MALVTLVPSAVTLAIALLLAAVASALPVLGTLAPGIAGGALAILPVNAAAVVATSFAFAFSNAGSATAADGNQAFALLGVIAGMAVRVVGTGLIALSTSLAAPAHLATTLSTVCVLLLTVLVGETLLYARRLLAPSTSESARV